MRICLCACSGEVIGATLEFDAEVRPQNPMMHLTICFFLLASYGPLFGCFFNFFFWVRAKFLLGGLLYSFKIQILYKDTALVKCNKFNLVQKI